MKKLIRLGIMALAVLAFVAAWAAVVVVYFATPSVAAFTVAVTVAALATEALLWTLAIIGGWTLFANRRKLWNRFTGQTANGDVS